MKEGSHQELFDSSDDVEADSGEEPPFTAYAVKAGAQQNEQREAPEKSKVDRENSTIAEMQQADPDIGPILSFKLQSDEQPRIDELLRESAEVKQLWSQWPQLVVINDTLYRTHLRSGDEVTQLIVPAACRQDFLEKAHEGMCGGHYGIKRTTDQV